MGRITDVNIGNDDFKWEQGALAGEDIESVDFPFAINRSKQTN